MNELALFAGVGGGILGGHLLGWRTVCAVEIETYCQGVLIARQNEGILPPFPIWDDVRTFDGKPWRGIVDVVSGGFPCQDISCAGRGSGITGEKSSLWFEMLRVIGEVQPRFAFMENSPMLTTRGLGTVLGGLAEIGYDAEWMCLSASDCGAPHKRERMWILAHTNADCNRQIQSKRAEQKERGRLGNICSEISDADSSGCKKQRRTEPEEQKYDAIKYGDWWKTEPDVVRVVDGFPKRVDRIRCLGNAQVPAVAASAFKILYERVNNGKT